MTNTKGGTMKMSRPFVLPDPDDRSKNEPCVIVSNQQVVGIYNQYNSDGDEMQKVTDKVKEWFVVYSKEQGWDEADFAGGQCILKNNFTK